jgi:hypothetical protein
MKSEKSFVDMCTREDEIFTKVGFGKEKSWYDHRYDKR